MYSCVVGSKHRRVSRERPCTSRSSRQKREADCLVVAVRAEARLLRAGGLMAVLVLDGTDAVDKEVLGGKALSLVRMLRLSINVPPAFCITTEECSRYHEAGGRIPRRCSTRCPARWRTSRRSQVGRLVTPTTACSCRCAPARRARCQV